MYLNKIALGIFLILGFIACNKQEKKEITLSSPDGRTIVSFQVTEEGEAKYAVKFDGKEIIKPSLLGFDAEGVNLIKDFTIDKIDSLSYNKTWQPVWGRMAEVEENYKQLSIRLLNKDQNPMQISFRIFNDGLGFRYIFEGDDSLRIKQELTEFAMAGNHTAWWIPADWDQDEHWYTKSKLSEIDTIGKSGEQFLSTSFIAEKHGANTPLTMLTSDGIHLSIHEAALVNFPGMSLKLDPKSLVFSSSLAASPNGLKATVKLPFSTPWRTIQISKDVPGLVNSYLIENLNEPNKLADVSWIKPVKYMGIWWEMHLDKSKWQYEGGKHGATTENAKRHIDFCAEHNIPALLIEGWNTGWETWWGENREGSFDFTTPYPDFNLAEVVAYGKTKGVEIIGHHETSSDVGTYNKRMDAGFALYKEVGVSAVKSGYVGSIIPKGEYHYGQFMVNHYNTVMQKTAENKIMLNVHEPIKPTGLCRTYPNLMSAEGMRGQEYNAWSTGNPPGHDVILAYTRNLAGPMDYTPGILDLTFENSKNKEAEKPYATRVRTTLAHQLGLYVVYYSPLQMAADLPENYAQHPAFQFIKDVGVDWKKSHALAGEIGEYIVMARQEKSTGKWFVGGITGENEKEVTLNFDFLEDGKTYQAIVYKDQADAHWDTNPKAYEMEKISLKKGDKLTLKMAAAGGFAISLE